MLEKNLAKKVVVGLFALTTALTSSASTLDIKADLDSIRDFIAYMNSRHNFDNQSLEQLFRQTQLRKDIVKAISKPAEAKPWFQYKPIFLTENRIARGIEFWTKNDTTLKQASEKFGVPENIMVAIIGVETLYGKHKGRYPVLDSLSTLAFAYPPRARFFKSELEQYLLMTREENMDPLSQTGSYAGAMGMPQFISSSFRRYAVDFDADGHRDLWNNTHDAIGSVGNYFFKHGWQSGQPIVHKVSVTGTGYQALLTKSSKPQWTTEDFAAAGIALPAGIPKDMKGTLIELELEKGKEYWIGWHNFYVITRYNHSNLYAMAVYLLGKAISESR